MPFWLQDLSGDGTPEVVLVGGVARYFQDHYVLKFTKKGTLHLVAAAMGKPAEAAGMLRLHFNSGRRAIYSREVFFRWEGDTLLRVADFHDEAPYNDTETPFIRITRYNEKGKDGKCWRISFEPSDERVMQYSVFSESPDAENGIEGTPAANVSFIWPEDVDEHFLATASTAIEQRYFWERLASLPWNVLPADPDEPEPPLLPKGVTVKVSGDPELVRSLSTDLKDRMAPPPARPAKRGNP